MKNILILIIAITLASSSLQGQLYVGAKLGLAPSLMSFESQPNHKSNPIFLNPLAGIMVEIPIVFGFLYNRKFSSSPVEPNLKRFAQAIKQKLS
ncbi:MAG: hypothetical protein IPL69_09335 [Saprospiraceae bacterium]|nr:hypothetical protein [Candidatus Brachybacter algidus]